GGPAVGGAEEAALGTGTVGAAEHGHEQPVRILGVHRDLRDLPPVAQSEVAPGGATIGGLVDAVAGGEVGALQALAAADVEDVGFGGGDGDRAHGAGGLVVEDRRPGAPVVVR